MRISLKVMPGAKRNEWKEEAGQIKVYLNAPAVEGKANAALVRFLAAHFRVKTGQIEIIKGLKSRHKVINIEGIYSASLSKQTDA
jgi:uncharacterized protein